jgi:hypothetical protein
MHRCRPDIYSRHYQQEKSYGKYRAWNVVGEMQNVFEIRKKNRCTRWLNRQAVETIDGEKVVMEERT